MAGRTLSTTAAGILKVTLPQDAGPAALHAAMTAAALHSSMTAALKAYSTALMPALLPLAHRMPQSHGYDVTMDEMSSGELCCQSGSDLQFMPGVHSMPSW